MQDDPAIWKVAHRKGFLDEQELAFAFAVGYQGHPLVSLANKEPEAEALQKVPRELCERYCFVPLCCFDHVMVIAIAEPDREDYYWSDIQRATDRTLIATMVAPRSEVLEAIERYYPPKETKPPSLQDTLLEEKVVTPGQIAEADAHVQKHGGRLGATLVHLGYLEDGQHVDFLSREYGVPSINLSEVEIPEDIIKLVSKDVCERHGVIPVKHEGNSLVVAMSDPSNIYVMDDIKFLTGYDVEVVVTTEAQIRHAIDRCYVDKTEYKLSFPNQEIFDRAVALLKEMGIVEPKDKSPTTDE